MNIPMKRQYVIPAFLSAGLILAGLHPLGLTWLSWLAFLPLFLVFSDPECRPSQCALSALITGIICYGVGLYWLLYYKFWIYAALFLILAPTWAIYFLILCFLTRRITWAPVKIWAALLLWIGLQKIYEWSPIGTLATEVPFYGPLAFLQIASVTNLSILGGILLSLNLALAFFIRKRSGANFFWVLFFIGLLTGVYFWGRGRLEGPSEVKSKFALIQHNLPVSGIWNLDHPDEIRAKYRELALKAAEKKPELIIFPLYNFPADILREPRFFTRLARQSGTHILAASYVRKEAHGDIFQPFFDVAVLYSPEGKIAGEYRAVERPPFRSSHELTADEYKVLETPFGKLGILLCYEDSRPKTARLARRKGADVLIALSNPGHFLTTHMPYYHLMQSRLRAIETGLPLIRVSANGYSAVIDSRGRLVARSDLNREQILSSGT